MMVSFRQKMVINLVRKWVVTICGISTNVIIKNKWQFIDPNHPNTYAIAILDTSYFYDKIFNPERDWNFVCVPLTEYNFVLKNKEGNQANEFRNKFECEVNPTNEINNIGFINTYFKNPDNVWVNDTIHLYGALVSDMGHNCVAGGHSELHPLHYLWKVYKRESHSITYEVLVFNERKYIRFAGFCSPPYANDELKYEFNLPFPDDMGNPTYNVLTQQLAYSKTKPSFEIIKQADDHYYLNCKFDVGKAIKNSGFYYGLIKLED